RRDRAVEARRGTSGRGPVHVARPHGLVLDQTFPVGLLRPDLGDQFIEDDKVFLRSVAERFPRRVHYEPSWTEISPANRRAFEEVEWKEWSSKWKFGDFEPRRRFLVPLSREPIDL